MIYRDINAIRVRLGFRFSHDRIGRSHFGFLLELISWLANFAFNSLGRFTISSQEVMDATYDWKNDQWTQLPLGVQINRIAIIRKSPVRFFYNPQYNFRDLPGNTRWQLVFGVSLLTQ